MPKSCAISSEFPPAQFITESADILELSSNVKTESLLVFCIFNGISNPPFLCIQPYSESAYIHWGNLTDNSKIACHQN